MAAAKKTPPAPADKTPPKTTAVVRWDEELAAEAEAAAKMEEGAAGGAFFSIKGGMLTFNDAPIPNNTIAAIVLDSILENVYYESAFDPDNPAPPTCFAFGRSEDELRPHKTVVEAEQNQNDVCGRAGQDGCCEHNEFGTAEKGRGKACRNVRRTALLAAGTFDKAGSFTMFEDAEAFETSTFGFLKIPVTSVKGYASYVKGLAESTRRPPWAFVTKIKVEPDAKTQVRVTFTALEAVPDELLAIIKKRVGEARALIEQPYPLEVEERTVSAPVRGQRGVPAKKAVVKKRY